MRLGLARAGFTVMTGAARESWKRQTAGRKEAGGRSIGCNIELTERAKAQLISTAGLLFATSFVRKVMQVKYSYAFIAFARRIWHSVEIFEAATLIQPPIRNFPCVDGKRILAAAAEFLAERLVREKTIDQTISIG